jgi:hypothetical protein
MFIYRPMTKAKRILGFLTVGLYGLVVAGLPLPATSQLSLRLVRFPCEDSVCGCASAERCWKACCCSTLEEKVAWAQQNGVAVPGYVFEKLGEVRSCCSKKETFVRGCCSKVPESNSGQIASKKSGHRDVRLISALGCGGLTDGLLGLVPAVVPEMSPSFYLECWTGSSGFPTSLNAAFAAPPTTPPPECC